MSDYGRELSFGTFLTPGNSSPTAAVALAQLSEELGLDLVTFQDHPYQPAFLDTWTLLSYVAATTIRVSLAPNVLNLPLRPPAMVARAAASLDLLSGGRFELGLGAGAFWEAIEAMGGPRRTPAEAVEALTEALAIIRAVWDTGTRGGVRVEGEHYRAVGAKRGPAPAHTISIWLGAYGPRMLRLTGRAADGWLPSAGYLKPDALAEASGTIDRAARAAGRDPADIRRLYNVNGRFSGHSGGFLEGPPSQWIEELTRLATEHGIDTFILGSDDPHVISTFAREVAPATRLAVAVRRSQPDSPPTRAAVLAPAPDSGAPFTVLATPDDGLRLTDHARWNESDRPRGPAPDPARRYSSREEESAQQLVVIHDHLRKELEQVRDLVRQVTTGELDAAAARSRINEMTIRQNNWTVGAYCAAYCRVVTTHHTIEDQAMFPRLRRHDSRLGAVLDRLEAEHQIIHEVLEEVDQALVALVRDARHRDRLRRVADELSDTLRSHLAYEERELLEPLARLGIGI